MTGSNLLQGLGLLVCIGAIILVALVAFAARAVNRSHHDIGNQNPNMWNTQYPEQPPHNNPDMEAQGGFGGVPNTGEINHGDMIGSSGFGEGAQSYDQGSQQNRENDK